MTNKAPRKKALKKYNIGEIVGSGETMAEAKEAAMKNAIAFSNEASNGPISLHCNQTGDVSVIVAMPQGWLDVRYLSSERRWMHSYSSDRHDEAGRKKVVSSVARAMLQYAYQPAASECVPSRAEALLADEPQLSRHIPADDAKDFISYCHWQDRAKAVMDEGLKGPTHTAIVHHIASEARTVADARRLAAAHQAQGL